MSSVVGIAIVFTLGTMARCTPNRFIFPVSLGRIDQARAAIAEGRRVRPDLSIDLMQNYLAVSRPAIDARRNTALRKAGLD